MIVECRLVHTIELGLHTQFVGVVADVKVDRGGTRQRWKGGHPEGQALVFTPIPSLTTDRHLHCKAFSVGEKI